MFFIHISIWNFPCESHVKNALFVKVSKYKEIDKITNLGEIFTIFGVRISDQIYKLMFSVMLLHDPL